MRSEACTAVLLFASCLGPIEPPPATCTSCGPPHIEVQAGARRWDDGANAKSCLEYRWPRDRLYEGDTGDGAYWIDPLGAGPLKAYCDMTFEDGGWTLVARGIAPSGEEWLTAGELAVHEATTLRASFKFADDFINAIPKTVYRFLGDGTVKQDWFWSGTCVYAHTAPATGVCNRSYPTSDLTDGALQGEVSSTHWGMGDWVNATDRGGLHTSNAAEFWFIRPNAHNDGQACRAKQVGCDVMLFVK